MKKYDYPDTWKRIREGYLAAWVEFFVSEYGKSPSCAIRGQALEWWAKDNNLSVHFDHRSETSIKQHPKAWLRRPCNADNIQVWRSANFGILCGICNRRLPTADRRRWFDSAMKYITQ